MARNKWSGTLYVKQKTIGVPAAVISDTDLVKVNLDEPTTTALELSVEPKSADMTAVFEVEWGSDNAKHKANFRPGQILCFAGSRLTVVVRKVAEWATGEKRYKATASPAPGVRPTVCGPISETGD